MGAEPSNSDLTLRAAKLLAERHEFYDHLVSAHRSSKSAGGRRRLCYTGKEAGTRYPELKDRVCAARARGQARAKAQRRRPIHRRAAKKSRRWRRPALSSRSSGNHRPPAAFRLHRNSMHPHNCSPTSFPVAFAGHLKDSSVEPGLGNMVRPGRTLGRVHGAAGPAHPVSGFGCTWPVQAPRRQQ